MPQEYWALSLDDLAEDLHAELANDQDGVAGHYARYTGTREHCIGRIVAIMRTYVTKSIYRSGSYGYPYDPTDEDESEATDG